MKINEGKILLQLCCKATSFVITKSCFLLLIHFIAHSFADSLTSKIQFPCFFGRGREWHCIYSLSIKFHSSESAVLNLDWLIVFSDCRKSVASLSEIEIDTHFHTLNDHRCAASVVALGRDTVSHVCPNQYQYHYRLCRSDCNWFPITRSTLDPRCSLSVTFCYVLALFALSICTSATLK